MAIVGHERMNFVWNAYPFFLREWKGEGGKGEVSWLQAFVTYDKFGEFSAAGVVIIVEKPLNTCFNVRRQRVARVGVDRIGCDFPFLSCLCHIRRLENIQTFSHITIRKSDERIDGTVFDGDAEKGRWKRYGMK